MTLGRTPPPRSRSTGCPGARRLALALMLAVAALRPASAGPTSAGAGARICGWFTPAETGRYLGVEVGPGQVGGPLDSLCHWKAKAAPGAFLQVQMSIPSHWAVPDLADHFRRVRGIGKDAYIVPSFQGWEAAARTDTRVIAVAGSGGTLTEDKTLDLLRAALAHP